MTSLPSQRSLWQDIMESEERKRRKRESAEKMKNSRQQPYSELKCRPSRKRARGSDTTKEKKRATAKARRQRRQERKKLEMKESPKKVERIRLYPTTKQKVILDKWFAAFRWTYNQCVAAKQGGLSETKLKQRFVNEAAFQTEFKDEKWVSKIPYDIRQEAVRDYVKAQKAHVAKQKAQAKRGERVQTKFQLKFKSIRKDPQQCVYVHKKHWKTKKATSPLSVSHVFYASRMRCEHSYTLPKSLPFDSRLIRTRTGKFYLCVPRCTIQRHTENNERVIAIDPGVRTFGTSYDNEGNAHEFGKNAAHHLIKTHAYRIDKLKSKICRMEDSGELNHKKRYRMKSALLRKQERMRAKVKEFHCKYAKWLCDNYNVVLLPSFDTQGMVKRKNVTFNQGKKQRSISTKTARAMCTMSHFGFKQRLLSKQREYPNCNVIICDEAYTSKTCGACGVLNDSLGGKKEFECAFCGYCADRDVNAARNILLKYIATD